MCVSLLHMLGSSRKAQLAGPPCCRLLAVAAMSRAPSNRCKLWVGNIPMVLQAPEVAAELAAYMVRPYAMLLQHRPFKDTLFVFFARCQLHIADSAVCCCGHL